MFRRFWANDFEVRADTVTTCVVLGSLPVAITRGMSSRRRHVFPPAALKLFTIILRFPSWLLDGRKGVLTVGMCIFIDFNAGSFGFKAVFIPTCWGIVSFWSIRIDLMTALTPEADSL